MIHLSFRCGSSLSKRFHQGVTHAVLLSFLLNILVPSYAFASTDVRISDPWTSGQLRTGIILRTSPFFYDIDPKKDASSSYFDPHSEGCDDTDSTTSLSDTNDDYGISDGESDMSDAILLDELMTDDAYAVANQPGVVRYGGYLLTCEISGNVRITKDHDYASSILHIFNPYGAVLLEDAMDFDNLYVEALRFEAKANIKADVCSLNLAQIDGTSCGRCIFHDNTLVSIGELILHHAHADFKGSLFLEEGKITLHNSHIKQHAKVGSSKKLSMIGQQSSWHIKEKTAVLGSEQSLDIQGVDIINKGIIEANDLYHFQGDSFENEGDIYGNQGVKIIGVKDKKGTNKGKIISKNGAIKLGAGVQLAATSHLESKEEINFLDDIWRTHSLQGNILCPQGHVYFKGYSFSNFAKIHTQKLTVDVRDSISTYSGSLIRTQDLIFKGKKIENRASIFIESTLSLSQKTDLNHMSGVWSVGKIEGSMEGSSALVGTLTNSVPTKEKKERNQAGKETTIKEPSLTFQNGGIEADNITQTPQAYTYIKKLMWNKNNPTINGTLKVLSLHQPRAFWGGTWTVNGHFTAEKSFVFPGSLHIKGYCSLGGESPEAVLQGSNPLLDVSLKEPARLMKKDFLNAFYEANKTAIKACGPTYFHDTYKMLVWLDTTQFFEKNPQHLWVLDEMVNAGGPWDWAKAEQQEKINDAARQAPKPGEAYNNARKTALSEEGAVLSKMKEKKKTLDDKHKELMKTFIKKLYDDNKDIIETYTGEPNHSLYKMMNWFLKTQYFEYHPEHVWMVGAYTKHCGCWTWGEQSESGQKAITLWHEKMTKQVTERVTRFHKKCLEQALKNKNISTNNTVRSLYALTNTHNTFKSDGGEYVLLMEDLCQKWTNGSIEGDPARWLVSPNPSIISILSIEPQGTFDVLPGLHVIIPNIENKGTITSLHGSLRLLNALQHTLGVIDMGNQTLIVETTGTSNWVDSFEKQAPQWLVHKFHFIAPKLELQKPWHFTYRNADGSNPPFVWGNSAELESMWSAWQNKQANQKVACDVKIDVVDFINQTLLNVTGCLDIVSKKNLNNQKGRIHATTLVATSRTGKVMVGTPAGNATFYHPNGAYMMSDADMTLNGSEGVDIDFGVLTCLGNAHFISPKDMLVRGGNVYIKGKTKYELNSMNITVTAIRNVHRYINHIWPDESEDYFTCNPTCVQMGSNVELLLGSHDAGALTIFGSTFMSSGSIKNDQIKDFIAKKYTDQKAQEKSNLIVKIESQTSRKAGCHHRLGWASQFQSILGTYEATFQTAGQLDLTKVQYFSMSSGTLIAGSANINAHLFYVNGQGRALRSYNIPSAMSLLPAIHHIHPDIVRYSEDANRPLFSINTFERGKPLPLMPLVVPPAVYAILAPLLEAHRHVDAWVNDTNLMIKDLMKDIIPHHMRLRYSMDLETLMMVLPRILLNATGMAFCHAHLSQEQELNKLVNQGWLMTARPDRKRIPLLSSDDIKGAPSFMALRLCDFKSFQPNQSHVAELTATTWKEMLASSSSSQAMTKDLMWDGILDPFVHVQEQDSSLRQALNSGNAVLAAIKGDFSLTGRTTDNNRSDFSVHPNIKKPEAENRPEVDTRPEATDQAAPSMAYIQRAHIVTPQGNVKINYQNGTATFQAVTINAQTIDIQADELAFVEDHDIFTSTTSHGKKSYTTHVDVRSVGNTLNARGEMFLRSLKEALTLQHITLKANKATLFSGCGMIRWLLGTNISQTLTVKHKDNGVWQSMRQDYQEHHTYSRNDASGVQTFVIETPEDRTTQMMVQEVQGYTSELVQRLKAEAPDAYVEPMLVREIHTYSTLKRWSLSRAAAAIVALGVMLITKGTAAELAGSLANMAGATGFSATAITGAATTAMVSASQTAAISLIQNEGNIGKTLKDVQKNITSRGFLTNIAESGLVPVSGTNLTGALASEVQKSVLRHTLLGERISVERIATSATATAIETQGSQGISKLKGHHHIDATQQVLLHGVVHGSAGAIKGIPSGRDAMIHGAAWSAAGAMSAEMLANILIHPTQKAADILAKNPDIKTDELIYEVRESLQPMRNAIQLMIAAGGLFAGDERAVNLMAYSAGTALDDNTLGEELQAAVREAMESQAVQLFKEASNKAFEVGKQVVENAGDWIEANPHKVEIALGAMAAISEANASNGGRRTAGMWKSWRIGGKQRASKPTTTQATDPLPKPEDRPLSSKHYSTAFQVRLKEGAHYPDISRREHFQECNKQLYHKIQSDQVFGKQMETLYPGITRAVTPGQKGAFPDRSPLNLSWHHNAHEPGLMELIPRIQHKSKGLVSGNLHPKGKGGYENWGIRK